MAGKGRPETRALKAAELIGRYWSAAINHYVHSIHGGDDATDDDERFQDRTRKLMAMLLNREPTEEELDLASITRDHDHPMCMPCLQARHEKCSGVDWEDSQVACECQHC